MTTKQAAKKSAAKTKAKTKSPAAVSDLDTQRALVKAIAALRNDPKKYKALRRALDTATSDDERAKRLIQYATSERQIAALLPARGKQAAVATIITVTVTTILIPNSAY